MMNDTEARQYIKQVTKMGMTLGLESIRHLLHELDHPEDDLKFIHIAGTNGKGSVLAYISTILERAGYTTGRYISPTVLSYYERIQVNQTPISKTNFSLQLSKIKQAINRMLARNLPHPSVFEIETALGLLHFKQENCDLVVIETGMGGRTDATNIIKNTLVSVFTSIGRDHMEFLGDTMADLTQAKAGIIKTGGHVVYGRLPAESEVIIKATAQRFDNPIHVANPADIMVQKSEQPFTQKFSYKELTDITIHLLGKHQIENAILAIAAVRALQGRGFDICDDQIKAGLSETRWFGRMTVVKEKNPLIIVDGAHNQDAVRALRDTLITLFPKQKVVGVMGVFKDKEVREMLNLIKPVMHKIHAISLPNEQRTLSAKALQQLTLVVGIKAEAHETLADALSTAISESEVVVVFGSLSYLGDVLKYV